MLQGITLTNIMNKKSYDVSAALKKQGDTIKEFGPQGPVSYRTEKAKVE